MAILHVQKMIMKFLNSIYIWTFELHSSADYNLLVELNHSLLYFIEYYIINGFAKTFTLILV